MKIKIGFVFFNVPQLGGLEIRMARLVANLIERLPSGSVVVFIQNRCFNEIKKFIPTKHHNCIVQFGNPENASRNKFLRNIAEVRSLDQAIKSEYIKHLHLCNNPGVISFVLALLRLQVGSDSVCMADTTYATNSTRIVRILGGLSLFHFKRVDCLSDQPKNLLLHHFPNSLEHKYRTAPCSFTDYSKASPQQQRDIDIVTMSRFVYGKGYELLEKIPVIASDFNLHCYGSGSNIPKIESAQISHTTDPFSILGKSKIYLSIQQINNYPSQATLEAMASGCAIIATDVGETRKFLNEECAIFIPYEASALEQAIRKLMKQPKLRQRLGKAAQKHVRSNHTIDRYTDYFLEEIIGLYHPHHHRP